MPLIPLLLCCLSCIGLYMQSLYFPSHSNQERMAFSVLIVLGYSFSQDVGYASDILHVLKLICFQFWSSELNRIDELRLSLIMRMLKTSHFSAKMNSLKEVSALSILSFCCRSLIAYSCVILSWFSFWQLW